MPKSASETLCLNLARGLHAAAQPLAILRAGLDKSYIDTMNAQELRELAASSALEVERVCSLFSWLRQLVSVESIKPHLAETPLPPLLANAADGVNLLFERDGMTLRSTMPAGCSQVFISRERTLQALSSVLLVAHSVSHPRDTIDLTASSPSSHAARIVVQNTHSYVDALNAEQSFCMALAETNMRSQEASLSWSLRPFGVQIELPQAPGAHYF
jgi:hypothetical protein